MKRLLASPPRSRALLALGACGEKQDTVEPAARSAS